MSEFIFHKTNPLERWDNIAYRYYKNAYRTKEIIEANPHVAITTILPEGIEIKIPVTTKTSDKTKLPIWKRNQ